MDRLESRATVCEKAAPETRESRVVPEILKERKKYITRLGRAGEGQALTAGERLLASRLAAEERLDPLRREALNQLALLAPNLRKVERTGERERSPEVEVSLYGDGSTKDGFTS